MKILPSDALLVIDPQNDFCPGGALAVNKGDEIMPGINALSYKFEQAGGTIVIAQEWHPFGHNSFASSHKGLEPFSTVQMPYGEQTLWPDHCVQNTWGAEFHPAVMGAVRRAHAIIRKGMNPKIDSYSAFLENDRKTATGLHGYLRFRHIERLFIVGLAYDFCVGYSALDSKDREVFVVRDLTRAIDLNGSSERMEKAMIDDGVKIITSEEFE